MPYTTKYWAHCTQRIYNLHTVPRQCVFFFPVFTAEVIWMNENNMNVFSKALNDKAYCSEHKTHRME